MEVVVVGFKEDPDISGRAIQCLRDVTPDKDFAPRKCFGGSLSENINRGMRETVGDWVAIINDDWLVPEGWLAELMRHRDQRVGHIGCHFISNGGMYHQGLWRLDFNDGGYTEFDTLYPYDFEGIVDLAYPLLIRRSAWEEVGGFDEAFVGSQFEDIDYAIRCKDLGFAQFYCGALTIKHLFHENGATEDVKRISQPRNYAYFKKKHAWRFKNGLP